MLSKTNKDHSNTVSFILTTRKIWYFPTSEKSQNRNDESNFLK